MKVNIRVKNIGTLKEIFKWSKFTASKNGQFFALVRDTPTTN